ncbi:MAG TPA: uroporphyrinogen decarboxylase family protein [Planctomycetota bacterium]|nr:uroporphyrinogen decarboxylase family protein [Planctomycetota bacterium]
MSEAMTMRERFRAVTHFEPTDRPFMYPQWIFPSTGERWHDEGRPADVSLNRYFGFDRIEMVPVSYHILPAFGEKTVAEDAETRTVVDESGAQKKIWKNLDIGMPHWEEFGLRTRDDWPMFKGRLNPDSPARFPDWFDDYVRCVKDRDYPLGISGGSYYGWIRNWVGMENLALLYYDDPGLVHEITDHIGDVVVSLAGKILDRIDDLDFAWFWEDMAMKTASLISPRLWREFLMPNYKRVTKLFREAGIDVMFVDCDGNTDELVPLWLESGVNGIMPVEVAAGCDVVKYRETYGKDLLLMGGIDKRALRHGKKEVEDEVVPKATALFASGSWIPFVDHAVPNDVPLENFQHYLDLVRDIHAATK